MVVRKLTHEERVDVYENARSEAQKHAEGDDAQEALEHAKVACSVAQRYRREAEEEHRDYWRKCVDDEIEFLTKARWRAVDFPKELRESDVMTCLLEEGFELNERDTHGGLAVLNLDRGSYSVYARLFHNEGEIFKLNAAIQGKYGMVGVTDECVGVTEMRKLLDRAECGYAHLRPGA